LANVLPLRRWKGKGKGALAHTMSASAEYSTEHFTDHSADYSAADNTAARKWQLHYECVNLSYWHGDHQHLQAFQRQTFKTPTLATNMTRLKTDVEAQYELSDIMSSAAQYSQKEYVDAFEERFVTSAEAFKAYLKQYPNKRAAVFGTHDVLREQREFLRNFRRQYNTVCDYLYYVAMFLHSSEKPDDYILVISMFVAVFPTSRLQHHFYIVKNPGYFMLEYTRSTSIIPVQQASILLHSFACSLFGSVYWCTQPRDTMETILTSLHFKSHVPTAEERETARPGRCYIFSGISVCFTIADDSNSFGISFDDIWKRHGLILLERYTNKRQDMYVGETRYS